MNVYQENGFASRRDYLLSLRDDFDVDWTVILHLADVLGPAEDFDGLVTALEDLANGF